MASSKVDLELILDVVLRLRIRVLLGLSSRVPTEDAPIIFQSPFDSFIVIQSLKASPKTQSLRNSNWKVYFSKGILLNLIVIVPNLIKKSD